MKKIKEARLKYNLTQHQMSELTGVPFRTIQNWECGVRECPKYVRDLVIDKLDRMFGKQSGWISVNDKMPKINTDVIIYHEGYIDHFLDIYTYLGDDAWEDSYGYWHRTDDICITHWMPLPEFPNVKGGEEG